MRDAGRGPPSRDRTGGGGKACGRQTALTAGSALHRTRLPLTGWFWAASLVTTHTPGLSAGQLPRPLGLSDETAGALLHKLRLARVHPAREPLTDKVEVDEPYLGGPEGGLQGAANCWRTR